MIVNTKLRWKQGKGRPPRGAVMIGDNIWQVLQQRVARARASECAVIDYSDDGEWIDVPAVFNDETDG